MTATDSLLTIEDALRAVRDLRSEVAELRQMLADGIRTRRVTIVDDRGTERVIVGNTVAERYGVKIKGDHWALIEMTAGPGEADGEVYDASLALMMRDGDACTALGAVMYADGSSGTTRDLHSTCAEDAAKREAL